MQMRQIKMRPGAEAYNRGVDLIRAKRYSEARAEFEKAYNAMVSLKGDGGRPLGIRPNVLLVPPSLENAAKELVEGDRLANGAYNPNKGKCKVIVSPWLL